MDPKASKRNFNEEILMEYLRTMKGYWGRLLAATVGWEGADFSFVNLSKNYKNRKNVIKKLDKIFADHKR